MGSLTSLSRIKENVSSKWKLSSRNDWPRMRRTHSILFKRYYQLICTYSTPLYQSLKRDDTAEHNLSGRLVRRVDHWRKRSLSVREPVFVKLRFSHDAHKLQTRHILDGGCPFTVRFAEASICFGYDVRNIVGFLVMKALRPWSHLTRILRVGDVWRGISSGTEKFVIRPLKDS
ncbi:hypothetical protein SISNIDRAFT_358213 [Sistotremastrum niveocremeum HHB9708]|uniref:Uncharacterized protein n=1 Tax=Sistotremastrum niveocremeum HHB9708 TaxID=1314777 RepID=A0A164WLC2_9AGAM|nr:hypothetical protein SISNIDRAFT_358213 [Sistotremastrum niveocremeum HHB9708]